MISIKDYVETNKKILKDAFSLQKIVDKEKNKGSGEITLHIIQAGNNQASNAYIKGKIKDGEELGVNVDLIRYPEDVDENMFLGDLDTLQTSIVHNNSLEGIIVQLPLPKNLSNRIELNKGVDVDGFALDSLVNPCTPSGIMKYLEYNNVILDGKNAVVIGRSNIVGKPMAKLLLEANANVTVLHSHTKEEDLKNYTKNADIIVCAVGKRNFLNNSLEYKKSAIVIDVGINRAENNKLCGDCEKDLPVAYQTPVPGGVGLLTRIALYENLFQLNRLKLKGELICK